MHKLKNIDDRTIHQDEDLEELKKYCLERWPGCFFEASDDIICVYLSADEEIGIIEINKTILED